MFFSSWYIVTLGQSIISSRKGIKPLKTTNSIQLFFQVKISGSISYEHLYFHIQEQVLFCPCSCFYMIGKEDLRFTAIKLGLVRTWSFCCLSFPQKAIDWKSAKFL